jgi:hypothetical protein
MTRSGYGDKVCFRYSFGAITHKKIGLRFSKAAPLCGDFAFPASGRQTYPEIIFASIRAFRCVFVSLLTVRETDLLPFRAGLGSECRRCRCGEIENPDKKNSADTTSHDRLSNVPSGPVVALYQTAFGRSQLI